MRIKNSFYFIKRILFLSFFVFSFLVYAQSPSVIKKIRIPLWAELDAYPGLSEAQDLSLEQYDYPIKSIKEVGPFLISGMVYGWEFRYTPSDKMRNVEEILEITEIVDFSKTQNLITYAKPWIQNNRLNCWCEYTRTESQIQTYYFWSSIQNPVIHGRGTGSIYDGFDGLKNASKDALKNAIRNYYRNTIKNKPKEITGKVLIKDIPTVGIVSGQYVINLDFFLECGKITEYKVY